MRRNNKQTIEKIITYCDEIINFIKSFTVRSIWMQKKY
jgi:hypothetical protein